MIDSQKENIRLVLARVAEDEINNKRDKSRTETYIFENNCDNFLTWLASKLGAKTQKFLGRLGIPNSSQLLVFCYAIENSAYFAQVLIETLEED